MGMEERSARREPTAKRSGLHTVRVVVGIVLLVVLVALVVDNTDDTIGYVFGDVALLGWVILHRPGRRGRLEPRGPQSPGWRVLVISC
jgi:hypothetical protein